MLHCLALAGSLAAVVVAVTDLRRLQFPTTPSPTIKPEDRERCNLYCKSEFTTAFWAIRSSFAALNGASSYCKHWLTYPVCMTGNQPCSADVCNGKQLSVASTQHSRSPISALPTTLPQFGQELRFRLSPHRPRKLLMPAISIAETSITLEVIASGGDLLLSAMWAINSAAI